MKQIKTNSGIRGIAVKQKENKASVLNFLVFTILSILFLNILSFNFFTPSVSAAAKASTLTLGVSTDLLSIDLMPSSSGTFGTSSTSTITAKTDNYTGYTLSINAANSTNLVDGSNHSISTLSSAVTESNFSSSSSYNNKWGYQPSQYISSGSVVNNTNYLPSPTTSGTTLDITNAANSTNKSYTIKLGARIDSTQPAGTYSNTFVIRAIANDIVYNITYNKNASSDSTVSNIPAAQGASIAGGTAASSSKVALSSTTPTRTGYTFAGWCDTATTNPGGVGTQTCSGNVYAAGSDFGIDQTVDTTNINLYAIWTAKTYTAKIYYNSNSTAGSTTITNTTDDAGTNVTCTVANAAGTCSPTIPSRVTGSVGTYNNAYVGVANTTGTMSSSTTITLSADATYYAVYRTAVTVVTPSATSGSNSASTATVYRNQWFTSTSAMSTTVLATSNTGTTNYTQTATVATSYSFAHFASAASTNSAATSCYSSGTTSTNCTSVAYLAQSTLTKAWAVYTKSVQVTFYYNNNSTPTSGTSNVVSKSDSSTTGTQYLRPTADTTAGLSNSNISVPSVVSGSYGTYNNAYAGVATSTGSMTATTPSTGATTYYAFYRTNVTNYYYSGSAYTSRTLYRNQTLSSTSAMGTTYLSTSSTGLSNYSTAGGPNSSTWYGLSTALSSTTRTYSTVAAAAASTSATLNTIYQFVQNFSSAGSTGVTNIGSTAEYCYVSSTSASAGGTSCTVTTPTISVSTGYSSLGWGAQGHTTQGTAESTSITVSTSGGTLYANAKINQYTCTKRYRLQNADGTWGSYTSDGTESLDYGTSCSYSKSVTDYKNTASGTNNAAASSSCTITTSGCTVSLDLYRNTFTLTVSRNTTHISSASATTTAVHGDNYYRWGQAVSISATANTNSHFTSWTQSGTTGTFGSATNASTTFTMGKGNSTVTAGGTYDTYTVTLNRNCSTTATGSTSATATYNSTTLSAITVPTCANATGTRNIGGFTAPAGNNADGATVTYPGTGCTSASNCKSTNTTTYTFNGWHDTSGTGTLVASTASTPALQASVSGYTNASSQWTRTSAATLYAGWNANAGSYSSVTLPTITKTGYTCGWTTTAIGATSITYASGGALIPTGNTTLYGVCTPNYIQDVTMSSCPTSNTSVAADVIDRRDGNIYKIQKLADGSCWMLDNLRLDPTAVSLNTLKSDTNASDTTLTYFKNGAGSSPAYNPYPNSGVSNAWTSSSEDSYELPYINAASKDTVVTGYGAGSSKVGVYYNYCAASAGSYCYGATYGNGDATEDICPAGWRMPTGNGEGDYRTLCTILNGSACGTGTGIGTTSMDATSTSSLQYNLSTPLSGRFYSGNTTLQGTNARYLSSSNNNLVSMHYLLVNSTTVYPTHYLNRREGASVRCVKNISLQISFSSSQIDSIAVKTGSASGTTIGTVTSSGGRVSGLTVGTNYYLVPTYKTGYSFVSWVKDSGTVGTLSSTSATNPYYTVAEGKNAVTLNSQANTYNLVITGDTNVSTMTVKAGSTSGTATTCTKSGVTFTCANLTYGTNYYLFPTFATGYEFNSWAKIDSATNAVLGSTSTENTYYQMGAGNGALTLTSKAYKTMQTMSDSDCTTTATTVVDNRDSEQYKVQRLADGNCWMLDNLRLDPTSVSLATLQGNTNASNQTLTYFKNGGGSSPYPANGVNTTWASSSDNKYDEPKVVTTYKDTTTTSYGVGSGKIGVYYNFCAASAGSYCYPPYSDNDNAAEDICPAGWKMPATFYSNEYPDLYTAYNSDATAFKQALSTPLSGSFNNGSATGQGSNGWFWSSTRYDDNSMYSVYVDSSIAGPGASHYRYLGFSMRCVKKRTYNLVVTADANVSSLVVRAGSTSGTATTCTKSGVTFTCANLTYGNEYYLFPTFSSGYEFNSWAKTDSATNAWLGSTSTENTYYRMGDGNGALTLTSKAATPYMQDVTDEDLNGLIPNTGDTIELSDKRDNQGYSVARLADGKVWMTENLNLAGGTTISCDTSDCDSSYTIPTTQGWQSGGKLPASSTSGFDTNNYAYVYNSGNTTCGSSNPCYSYYSWDAATLGSGRNITADNTDAPYSICPKGWHLPNTRTGTNSTSDFRALMIALGGSRSVEAYNNGTSPTGAVMFGRITASPNYYRAGHYSSSGGGGFNITGFYLSSTSQNSTSNRQLYFGSNIVNPINPTNRSYGASVRCVKKEDSLYMQDVTSSSISGLLPNVGDNVDLVDKRDGKTYKVAKLADGNVWMLDNLALDPTAVSLATLQGNTNASNTTLNYLKNGGGTASNQYAITGVGNLTSGGSYSEGRIDASNKDAIPGDSTLGIGSRKVGVYYNFCAASAGSYCYGNGTSAGSPSGNASEDLCPSGWRLPTGGSSGEYAVLYNNSNYNTYTKIKTALSLPLAGRYYNGTLTSSYGENGHWWSSTKLSSNNYNMYDLYLTDSSASGTFSIHRSTGGSIRCIKDIAVADMQTMLDSDCTTTATTVKDSRDGELYVVQRLADGNCWMLDNLRLDPTNVSLSTLQGNTNASNTTLNYLKNGGGTTSDKYATAGVSSSWSELSYSVPLINASSKNTTTTSYGVGSGKIGVYYNYCAASAGSYCYGNGTSYGTSSGDATEDLCPAGWRMPTGGYESTSSNEYNNLAIALDLTLDYEDPDYEEEPYYGGNTYQTALSLPLSGRYTTNGAGAIGNNGASWSSSRWSNSVMHGVDWYSSYSRPFVQNMGRHIGYSMRCVKQ